MDLRGRQRRRRGRRVGELPTTTPAETLGRAVEFFAAVPDLEAVGVGAFGPVEVNRASPRWGTITTTPKPGWRDTDVVAPLAAALGVPIALDTDVNAAAVGEWRHGAAQGSTPSSTSPSAPGSAAASSPTAGRSTACSTPRSATC